MVLQIVNILKQTFKLFYLNIWIACYVVNISIKIKYTLMFYTSG